jgi:hypothetical protein
MVSLRVQIENLQPNKQKQHEHNYYQACVVNWFYTFNSFIYSYNQQQDVHRKNTKSLDILRTFNSITAENTMRTMRSAFMLGLNPSNEHFDLNVSNNINDKS